MKTFSERWSIIRSGMEAAAERSGRKVDEIQLVAVSKGHPASAIAEAYATGQLLFGESRVQEAKKKVAAVPGVQWHFIGHLQKNKVRQALPLFEVLESVHSLELAHAIDRIAGEMDRQCQVLLEVNVANEGSKYGFSPDELRLQMDALSALPRLRVNGLMAIPPYSEDPEHSRQYFVQLRELRDELGRRHGASMPTLSMGMSNDYHVAIEEGATSVRVGTALFGER